MVVAPVLLVCELLKSEYEILVLTDNVVGFFEIDAKFAVKYFHIATPTFQQVINLENDSFHKNVLLECLPYLFRAAVCLTEASRENLPVKVNNSLNISEHDEFPLP